MKNTLLLTILLAVLIFSACNNTKQRSFAIVIDKESYSQAQQELEAYMSSIQKDGLNPILVIDKWQQPDSIRKELIKLYNTKNRPIEGAVFIGDIPIAMLRDAQHLSSAFKMKQSDKNFSRSSIPSDRFYDDFDLNFKYIKQDTVNSLLHYYSLIANSAHLLQPEIYTGRIKPFNTEHKYEDLKKYLNKVVEIKKEDNQLNQVLYFAGHGYNSDCMIARIDENEMLSNQFTDLQGYKDNISFINHNMDDLIKERLIGEIQREDLDLAIFHHHGANAAEYLNGLPEPGNTEENIEAIKIYVRSKLNSAKRKGKNIEKAKKYYCKKLDIPEDWFDDAFTPQILKKDSTFGADMDMHINDVSNATPNVRMLLLDACFNGSFQHDKYIAGAYIFNNGKTVVVQANSVNSLQDKLATEFVGLLGMGMRFGAWSKYEDYLETHVFGDPTYHLSSPNSEMINKAFHNTSLKFWNKMLDSKYPAMQAFAVRKLYENAEPELSDKLLKIYKTSPYPSVRNEALRMLTACNDNNFIECLKLAVDDPYEFIRRTAAYLVGDSGDPQLAGAIVKTAIRNNTSKRVAFAARESLGYFNQKSLEQELSKQLPQMSYANPEKKQEEIRKTIERSAKYTNNMVDDILNPETEHKWIISNIRSLRNRPSHEHVEELCDYLINKAPDDKIKTTLIETFGWFNISYKKPLIIETCKKIANDSTQSENVRHEALKTINRLSDPWYR